MVEGDRRGRLFRLDGVPLERGERVRPQPRAGVARHSAQLPDRVRLRAAVRRGQEVGDERRRAARSSAAGSSMACSRAYQGRPVHADRVRLRRLNMPGNQQTPDQIKEDVEDLGNVGDDGTFFDTTRVRARHRGAVRQRGPEHDAWARRGEPGSEPVPHVQALPRRSICSSAAEAFNVTNTPHFANPNGNVNSSNFGRILSTNGNWADGADRASSASGCGCRFSSTGWPDAGTIGFLRAGRTAHLLRLIATLH